MKKIFIVIPCFNEEDNINRIYDQIKHVFSHQLPNYKYDFLFIDNDSTDNTKQLLIELANNDKNVKVIFNTKNFGWIRSSVYGLINTNVDIGEAVIFLAADMQEPPEMIPHFVKEWENGYKIVIGIKNKSKENPLIYFFRTIYYRLIKYLAEIEHIDHFTGFGLYDYEFIEVLRKLNDPIPYLRGIVAELGYKHKKIYFEQEKRKAGKSKFNFPRLYDFAMLGFTSYSKIGMRYATMLGFFFSIISFLIAIYTFIYKLINWDSYDVGIAAIVVGVFFLGSLQLFFIGLLGEYILNINTRVINRPLVVEESRINFDHIEK
jgi:glycosyltransferase involved in cell wall biosynthesis